MRAVSDHLAAVLDLLRPLPPLDVSLPDAVGCILAEDIRTGQDLPAWDIATCDGYAVRSADVEGASLERVVELRVLDEVKAGDTDPSRVVPHAAVRIASGAPLPTGADTVIPLPSTDQGEAVVQIHAEAPVGSFVRAQGADLRADQIALATGERIGARQIAVLAALGHSRVLVHPRPRVVVVSVGSELVEPGRQRSEGMVYDANGHSLVTAIQDAGGATFRVAAVRDERAVLTETLEDQLVRADLVITTGGLSFGANDTVKEVLSPLGTVRFDNVDMSPGRQFGVGTIADGTPILALPGDPVSALIAFEIFVRPGLLAMAGYAELYRPTMRARLEGAWRSPRARREFVPAMIVGDPDVGYRVSPVNPPGELLLSGFARANSLMVVAQDVTVLEDGEQVAVMVLES